MLAALPQVIDLVHPSLYCLRIGRSRQTDAPFRVDEALSQFGAGRVKGEPGKPVQGAPAAASSAAAAADAMEEDEAEEEEEEKGGEAAAAKTPADLAALKLAQKRWLNKSDYSASEHYAWLPAEFDVDDDRKVAVASYINNLHPVEHAALYPVLASITEQFLPMWERVLTFLKAPPAPRIQCGRDWYEGPPKTTKQLEEEEAAKKSAKRAAGIAGRGGGGGAAAAAEGKRDEEDGGEEEENEDDEENEEEDEDEDDYFENRTLYQPDVSVAFKPPSLPADKQVSLTGRRLQIIVKLANIELTPEQPKYAGGSWHVEGMEVSRNSSGSCAQLA